MKTSHTLGMIAAALVLSACGSAGRGLGDALLNPFEPKPGGHYNALNVQDSGDDALLGKSETLSIYDESNPAGKYKRYKAGSSINIGNKLQNRVSALGFELFDGRDRKLESGELDIYKLSYSAVVGKRLQKQFDPDSGKEIANGRTDFTVKSVQGIYTEARQLPKSGVVRYQGIAFAGQDDQGRLNYNIDFGTKKVSGQITDLRQFKNKTIELMQSDLAQQGNNRYGILGSTKMDGNINGGA